MLWKNIGITGVKNKTVDNFTTDIGIKFRKNINEILRKVIKNSINKNIIIESYPKLESGKSYIFAATHSFEDDITTAAAVVDRSAYMLLGTTDQIEHNPKMYIAWLKGMIYVDRFNDKSRKESLDKMERILNSGTSVIIFVEGGLNNTENKLCNDLFASPYILSQRTGCEVVPLVMFNEYGSNDIYVNVGEPINLVEIGEFEKEIACTELKNKLAMPIKQAYNDINLNTKVANQPQIFDTLNNNLERLIEEYSSKRAKKAAMKELKNYLGMTMFEFMLKYATPISRDELDPDCRINFLEQRRRIFLTAKWSKDVWAEELTVYYDKDNPTPEQIRESLDKVKITPENAYIFAPILAMRAEDEKYNFLKYMEENWNKPIDENTYEVIKQKKKTWF